MGTLTVRENLQFSAALRLPSHMTRSQRKERVEKVIAELGLQACVDTKVHVHFTNVVLLNHQVCALPSLTWTLCASFQRFCFKP